MNLLVISRMFPSPRHPTSAIFFANFLARLDSLLDKTLVLSPRVYVPWVLSFRSRWARHRRVAKHDYWNGIEVVRPAVLVVRAEWAFPYLGRLGAMSMWPAVKRFHRRIRFDAVLGFNALPDGDSAVRLADRLGVPAIVWCAGSDLNDFAARSGKMWRVTRRVLEGASLVVTSSAALTERAKEIAPGIYRVQPFYRGIDLDVFRSQPPRAMLRRSLGLPADASVLVYVGRFMPEKGTRELLEVFRRLADRRPPVHLVLAGENVMGAELDELIARSGAADRVIRPGIVPHERAAGYLSVADVLVFGSYQEGLPNAVVEAMAAGTAVVTTGVGGVPEIVTDGENGLVVLPRDADALFAATRRMLDDAALRARCVEAGRRLVFERFDSARNARAFAALLQDVVSAWRQRGGGAGERGG